MFGGMFGKLAGAISDSVSKMGAKKDNLSMEEEWEYNQKYDSWMPKGVDADQWAKENINTAPPPPKAGGGSGANGSAVVGKNCETGSSLSAPHTPLAGNGGGSDSLAAPASGSVSFRAPGGVSGGRRGSTRSRYVDTFNPSDGADAVSSDAASMPPPPARPKSAYKVFTPQKTAGDIPAADELADAATPLFMTPTADVYAAMKVPDPIDSSAPQAPPPH